MIVTISEADLREMEKKGLVTAEEAARIRKKQSERTRKLAAQLDAPPSPPSSQIAIPDVPPEPVRRALPPHLEALVGRDERELEDLHNAGFLKDDDYQQVLEARRV
jgi:hypothetical protein